MVRYLKEKPAVLMAALLMVAVVIAYGNSVLNGFVWDDHDIIVNNPVNRDVSFVGSLFLSADSTITGNQKAYYRPLNRLTYMLDYQLFGLQPFGYHLENLLIHLFNTLFLFFLARTLFSRLAPAFIAALLFAVHPVNTEAVNFLSALSYIRYGTTDKKSYTILAGLFFFAGLLCKEPAFMLPVVLVAYEYADSRSTRAGIRRVFFSLLPFVIAAVIYLALRMNALSSVVSEGRHLTQGLGDRLLQNIYIIPKYLFVLLFPVHLNALYSLPHDYLGKPLLLIGAWIAVFALFLLLDKKSSAAKFGLIWFAVNYIPISNIVPIPSAPLAERYLYLPAIGLWIVAADAIYRMYERARFKLPLQIAGGALVLCLAVLTINRNTVWKDDIRFYTRLSETNPDSALAQFSLGQAYWEKNNVPAAQEAWKRTAEINEAYFNVLGRLGESYVRTGFLEQAEYYYRRETEVNPADALALFNLAVLEEKLKKPQEALVYYQRFVDIQPEAFAGLVPKAHEKINHITSALSGSKKAR
jgi:tetratricopeptide (TPR) repeat protein